VGSKGLVEVGRERAGDSQFFNMSFAHTRHQNAVRLQYTAMAVLYEVGQYGSLDMHRVKQGRPEVP
jgi:hypothetical protein